MNDRMKGQALGAILLQSQIVTPEQIERALAEQARTGRRLGEVLMDLGIVSAEDVRWGLSQQQAYSFVRVRAEAVDPEAIRLVPADVARRLLVVPFLAVGDELTVVMDDPTNRAAIAELAEITGRQIVVSIGLPDEIRAALDACYGRPDALALDEASLRDAARSLPAEFGLVILTGARPATLSRALAILVREVLRDGWSLFHLGPSGLELPAGVRRLRLPGSLGNAPGAMLEAALARDPDLISIEDLSDPEGLNGAIRAAAAGFRVLAALPVVDATAAIESLIEGARSRALLAAFLDLVVVLPGRARGSGRLALIRPSAAARNAIRTRPAREAADRLVRLAPASRGARRRTSSRKNNG